MTKKEKEKKEEVKEENKDLSVKSQDEPIDGDPAYDENNSPPSADEEKKEDGQEIKQIKPQPVVSRFVVTEDYEMIQSEDGVHNKQKGTIFDASYKPIGKYPYTPPKDLENDGKPVVTIPKDANGNPMFVSDMPFSMIQSDDGVVYVQHKCIYDHNKKFIKRA